MPSLSRTTAVLSALLALALASSACSGAQDPPDTVAELDLQRYLGTWYEIAAYPIRPQRGCTATTATYSLRDDGRIDVLNRCRDGALDGDQREATAIALLPDEDEPARLKVQFFWPLRADYWVVDLDEDYQTAVVSDPDRRTLWILHREPCMPDSELRPLLTSLDNRGFDLSELQATLQQGDDDRPCQAALADFQ